LESLDGLACIKPSPVKHHERTNEKYSGYQQPKDLNRYHRAPGPLRVAYPTCTFQSGNAVITYGYGSAQDPIGGVFCKIRVVPVGWFYKR
jgi:hypothetical protein